MSQNRYRYFTTYNFAEKQSQSENEDASVFHCFDNKLYFSLSDGAGGVGVFSSAWAQHVTQGQPDVAFGPHHSLDQWLLGLGESFYNRNLPKAERIGGLVLQKFYEEGSYATLLYVWIDEEKERIMSLGIGDTCLFHFRLFGDRYILEKLYPINLQHSIDDFPKLLNWNSQHFDWPALYEHDISKGDILICCTDALARFFIRTMYNGDQHVFGNILSKAFLKSLETEQQKIAGSSIEDLLGMIGNFFDLPSEEEKIQILKSWVEVGLEDDDFTIASYIYE